MTEHLKKGVDYVGVGVVFFCHDGKGNFLMAKRNGNSAVTGDYSFTTKKL